MVVPEKRLNVTVVVLGDLGRSPRMQYHALALANNCGEVELVGYSGKPVCRAVRENRHIRCHFLPAPALRSYGLPGFVFVGISIFRLLAQSVRLFSLLLVGLGRPDFVLVQSPPAIPTLFVALVAARLRNARLIIDWHNFGYSMLSLRLGRDHFAVRLARWYERTLGWRADAHFCVSRAMSRELLEKWGIDANVLYDCPADGFAPTSPPARRELFQRLDHVLSFESKPHFPERPDQPVLIVSPTSWTPDEDYDLLLEAVRQCDERIEAWQGRSEGRAFPTLLVLITGDGPLREEYERRIAALSLRKISLRTLWLSPEDYSLLLGSADLGICLHRSSSGVDLPMKLADMLGSGLPACALDYGPCLKERLHHGENGLLFSNSEELAGQLFDLFKGYPQNSFLFDQLRRGVAESSGRRWSDEWKEKAMPVFSKS